MRHPSLSTEYSFSCAFSLSPELFVYRICVTSRVKEKELDRKREGEREVKMNVSNIEMCFNEKCSQCAGADYSRDSSGKKRQQKREEILTYIQGRERVRDIVCDSSKWMTLLLSPASTDSSMHAQ